ncbi:MAG: hypothetical protein ABI723_21615 [Bacteroidia bacterium]
MKNIVTLFLAFYLLIISSGFTISHIYCSKGQRYFLGSEMPPCKRQACGKECCSSQTQKDCSSREKKDNRKKDTLVFLHKFQSVQFQKKELIKPLLSYIIIKFIFTSFCFDLYNQKDFLKTGMSNPPPLLSKPDLSKIRVLLI